jgi:hypothetical protein
MLFKFFVEFFIYVFKCFHKKSLFFRWGYTAQAKSAFLATLMDVSLGARHLSSSLSRVKLILHYIFHQFIAK